MERTNTRQIRIKASSEGGQGRAWIDGRITWTDASGYEKDQCCSIFKLPLPLFP